MDEIIEEVDFLARSGTRVQLLEALYDAEQLEKDALKDVVDASRTTIQRNLDALKERGWIDGDNREYWITQSGKPVAKQYLALLDTIYVARRFEPFLEWIPSDAFDPDVHALADADLITAEENDPYAPVNRHVEFMLSVERFRCALPAVGLQPLLVCRDCVVEHDRAYEVIVDSDVAEVLRSNRSYRDVLEELLPLNRFDLLVSRRRIPFYLGLGDDVVQIGVGDDEEVPRSLVETANENVREWAQRTYEEYRIDAEPFGSQPTGAEDAVAGSTRIR